MGGSDNLPTPDWSQLAAGADQFAHGTQLQSQPGAVLGRPCRRPLGEQAAGPIANPKEMAFTHTLALDVLNSIPQYREAFRSIYQKDEITLDAVTDAIAQFEETLVTPTRVSTSD